MRKFNINVGLIIAIVVLVIVEIITLVYWKNVNAQSTGQYTSRIAELEATISGYGSEVTCWTVASQVKAGDIITEDNLEPLTMYSSLLTDQYITDTSTIIGQYFKIAVSPGTPLFYNSVMSDALDDTTRDRDIVLDKLPTGIAVGDYIDIRITMPYGDDYVVISHKRVYAINDNSIKLYMTELEWNTYLGAMVDYYLNQAYGCTIYGDKYVEPGLQQEAVAYYAVPTNIAALLQKNPNIVDKEKAASLNEWRTALEELLVIFRDEEDTTDSDGSLLAAGRALYNENVTADRKALDDALKEAEEEENEEFTDEVDDSFWDETPGEVVDDMTSTVDDVGETVGGEVP